MDPITSRIGLGAAGAGGSKEYWIATLGDNKTATGTAIGSDSYDNVIVGGFYDKFNNGLTVGQLASYDLEGNLLWQRDLDGSSLDTIEDLTIESSNRIIVVGSSADPNSPYYYRAFLNQYYGADDPSPGTALNKRFITTSNHTNFLGVAIDGNGDYVVGGQTRAGGLGEYDALFTRFNHINSLGIVKSLGYSGGTATTARDFYRRVAVDSSDNYYLTGYRRESSGSVYQGLIAKYNSSGTLQWHRYINDQNQNTLMNDIAVDTAGNVYCVGYSFLSGSNHGIILKYNSSGTVQWRRTLAGTGDDNLKACITDSSNNLYVAGSSRSIGTGANDAIIAKYNSSGTLQWQRYFGGGGNDDDYFESIALDSSENILLCGKTETSSVPTDILIVKLPNDGSLTGTHGPYTYAASSLTDASSSLPESAGGLTEGTPSLTLSASSMTDAASNLTQQTTTYL